MNREAWLQAAIEDLRPLFKGHGYDLGQVHVSVGWPSSGGLGTRKRTIGQCWCGTTSEDGKPHVFISPLLAGDPKDPMGALATLVHELVHVVVGTEAKHGPKFAKCAHKLGLEGKPTSTSAGEGLIGRLVQLVEKLGPFPHAKLTPAEKLKKQTTRMHKCECGICGFTVRLSKKWAEVGAPICPTDNKPMNLDLPPEEDDGDGEGEE